MLLGVTVSLAFAAATVDTAPAPSSAKPRLICRESEQPLGSHIRSGRRCKTAEDWQQEDLRRSRIPPDLTVVPHRGDGAVPPPVNTERPFV